MKYLQRIHPTFWLFICCLSLYSARETKEDIARDFDSLRAGHWSWKELDDPTPPKVKAAKRVRNDIDRFILSKLETEGHGLSEEADANTLNRRAHLDLVGLPPSPEKIEEFVQDASNGLVATYEKLIDELLQTTAQTRE